MNHFQLQIWLNQKERLPSVCQRFNIFVDYYIPLIVPILVIDNDIVAFNIAQAFINCLNNWTIGIRGTTRLIWLRYTEHYGKNFSTNNLKKFYQSKLQ